MIFDPRPMLSLYLAGKHDDAAQAILNELKQFNDKIYLQLGEEDQCALDLLIRTILYILTQPDLQPHDDRVKTLILSNPLLSNLVAISSFRNTDPWVTVAMNQRKFWVILVLYSARNTVDVDRAALFKSDPTLASMWWSMYCNAYRGWAVTEAAAENMRKHFTFTHPLLAPGYDIQEAYFGSTYIPGEPVDRAAKQSVNRYIRSLPWAREYRVKNKPDPKKVAVISGYWKAGHSVYRTLRGYVAALKPEFHLTLVKMSPSDKEADPENRCNPELFDEVIDIPSSVPIKLGRAMTQEWAAVFYPDIGMTLQSLMMSHLRLAPVQLMGTGHPVSTFGSEIDYFISGEEVEAPDAQRHYSERLVLIPGLGAVYEMPDYKLTYKRKKTRDMLIACSWYGQKVNYQLVRALAAIVKRSTRKLHFRVFSGGVIVQRNGLVPLWRELQAALAPASVEVLPHLEYKDYMAAMEECDFALDCFPFGGSNTVSDLLWLRKPVVCLEGDRWFGRIGSALIRRTGLSALACASEAEYIEAALRMIHDATFRRDQIATLWAADMESTVYDQSQAVFFRHAIRYLIDNHALLSEESDREPIRLGGQLTEAFEALRRVGGDRWDDACASRPGQV
jgi:hypothetical protein